MHRLLFAAALLFSAPLVLLAQTAQITGRIADASPAVVPNAQISVTHVDTGITRVTASNSEGYYTVPLLPRGNYKVGVELEGFRPVARSGITLDEGQVLRLDFTLEVGQVVETVNVSGAAPLLEAATTALSTVIPNQKVVDLPLNGRNPVALAALVPGVRPIGTFGVIPTSAFFGTQVSIGGGGPSANNIMVDGVAAENMTSGGFQINLSVDATEEFRIITRNPSAEYGRTGGGVMNMISKSGTNEFQGAAWEFFRNKVLNANDFFANRSGRPNAPLVFNEYGATLGGPVRKERTFFFANWEQFKQRTQARTFRTVPTALQQQGNFSETRAASGQLITIYDPLTTRPDPSNPGRRLRDPFPGNLIPTERIHPVSKLVTGYYPAPNVPGTPITGADNFLATASGVLNKNTYGAKIDHNFTSSKRLSGRYTRDVTFNGRPAFFSIAEPSGSDQTYRRLSGVLTYTDTLKPDLLLEARAGVNRYASIRDMRSLGFDVSKIGLPTALNSQTQFRVFPLFSPTDVSAIGSIQDDYPKQANNSFTQGASLTKIKAQHTIKFGAERREYQNNNTQGGPNMQFAFSRSFTNGPDPNVVSPRTGFGFATFLLGTPSSGEAKRWPTTTYQGANFGTYVQDDWKVSPKLTLNLGLRWEFEGAVTDRYKAISNFDPLVKTTVNGITLVGGEVYPGKKGLSRGNRDNSFRDFGPRFGFAYQLRLKTVVRGGYGIYHLPGTGNFVRLGQTGFSLETAVVTSIDGGFRPYDTLTNPFPNGIALPPGSKDGALTALGTPVEGNLRSLKRGYSQQWNFNIQQELPGSWLVEIGYAGNHGVSLPANTTYDYLPASARALGTDLQRLVANPYAGLITTGPLSQATVTRGTLLDTFPQFLGASGLDSWANSIYHALTVRLEKRFSRGFSVLGAYTFSKLIDDNLGNGANNFTDGGSNSVQDWENRRTERAVSTSFIPQRLALTGSWELPIGKAGPWLYRHLLGKWQINSMLTLQSGNPISVSVTAPAFGGNRPNVVGDPTLEHPTIDRWLNPAAFATIAPFTLGNAPRNLPRTRTDSLFNWDFSVLKAFPLRERISLQFRAEFFNFTNTPTFGSPNTNLNSTSFGVVNSLGPNMSPRQIQLGLKLYF